MEILFVATNLPIPPNSGQSIRSLSIIQALESIGHDLTFISFASKGRGKDLRPLSSFCRAIELLDQETQNLTLQKNYLPRLNSLLRWQCYSIERFRSTAMQNKIQDQLNRGNYNLILCDGIHSLINIPKTRCPILLNCHNVEHTILSRYARIERNPIKKYYALLESSLMRTAESNGCSLIDHAMVCSENDLEILQKLCPSLAITVVPNVVDTDSIQPTALGNEAGKDPVLLFQGVMDWYPNRDAVAYFARNIFSSIRADSPEVRFVVAGRNPPKDFVELFRSEPNLVFTGTVPDMRPFLDSASIVVIPLRLGGGTRIKILEACASGKPVVSTSIGAEGLDLAPGKEILLADEPSEFARCVISLLRDPIRSEALARAARAAVVERYSHGTLKRTLEALVARYRTQETTEINSASLRRRDTRPSS